MSCRAVFVKFHQGVGLLPSLPFLSRPFSSLPSLPLDVGPLNPATGVWGSASRNRIWCFLAIKSDIWWQQLEWFSLESTDQILCTLNSKGNSVTVAIGLTATLYLLHAGHNVRTITYKTALLDLEQQRNQQTENHKHSNKKNRSLSADLHKFYNQLSTASLHHITCY